MARSGEPIIDALRAAAAWEAAMVGFNTRISAPP